MSLQRSPFAARMCASLSAMLAPALMLRERFILFCYAAAMSRCRCAMLLLRRVPRADYQRYVYEVIYHHIMPCAIRRIADFPASLLMRLHADAASSAA